MNKMTPRELMCWRMWKLFDAYLCREMPTISASTRLAVAQRFEDFVLKLERLEYWAKIMESEKKGE